MRPAIIALIFISSAVAQTYRLDSLTALDPLNVKPAIASYRGHRAVHLIDTGNADPKIASGALLAVLTGSDFKDGTIDVDLSGAPAPGAPGGARGFVGIAFRVQPDHSRYECFYLRPPTAAPTINFAAIIRRNMSRNPNFRGQDSARRLPAFTNPIPTWSPASGRT
jgi:hypothetical protein